MSLSKENKAKIKQKKGKRLANHEIEEAYDDARVAREFTSFKRVTLTKKQQQLFDGINKHVITAVTGPAGTSKAQPLTAKILTPNGWTRMGDIKVGDFVIGVDGKKTEVTGVYPYGNKDVYTVSFSDGSSTECCLDHLWHTKTTRERNYYKKVNGKKNRAEHPGGIRTTQEIMDSLYLDNRLNHSIPIVDPVEFEEADLPIHPYLMGALLGDGGLTHRVLFSSKDEFIINAVNKHVEAGSCKMNLLSDKNGFKEYSIVDELSDGKASYSKNKIKSVLSELGVFGKKSSDKFIPHMFLYGSVEQRISLLNGLMDTDGTTSGTSVTFCTVSKNLRDDVIQLVRSLGGIATYSKQKTHYVYKSVKHDGQDAFIISISLPPTINPFSLPRKANKVVPKTKYKPVRYITNISYKGTDNVQCISVADDKHLYVTDDYIVTHNTFSACYAAIEALRKGEIKKIYLVKPLETSGEETGFLPGDLDEKMKPYMQSFVDNLVEMVEGKDLQSMMQSKVIEFVPIAFMRGRTLKDAYVLIDECQNSDIKQLMTLVTRLGKNSKMIFLGDQRQNDINKRYLAFNFFVEKILDPADDDIFSFQFSREDIVRHPLLIRITDRYEDAEINGLLPDTKNKN